MLVLAILALMDDLNSALEALLDGQLLPAGTVIQRSQLHYAVWSTPLRKLAPKFGYSDVGLRKACLALDIPLPGIGHWAKVAAGHVIKVPPLPNPEQTGSLRTHGASDSAVPRAAEDQAWLSKALAAERTHREPVDVEVPSPVIAKLQAALRRAEAKYCKLEEDVEKKEAAYRRADPRSTPNFAAMARWTLDRAYAMSDHDAEAMRVSRAGTSDAIAIMTALCCGLESRGHKVGSAPERGRVRAVIHEEQIAFGVRERFNEGAVRPSVIPGLTDRSERVGAGEFVLFVEGLGRSVKEFKGTAKQLIDGMRGGSTFEALYRRVVHARQQRREEEAQRAIREARRKLEEERRMAEHAAAELARVERERRAQLFSEAAQWHKIEQLRRYIESVRTAAGSTPSPELATWLSWAAAAAEAEDPLTRRLASGTQWAPPPSC